MRSARIAWMVAPVVVLLGLMSLYPIADAVMTSLNHGRGMSGDEEDFVGLENYARVSRDPEVRQALGFTLLFVAISVPLEIALGLAIALVLHRMIAGRGMIRALVLIPWAIPTVVVAWMWWYIFEGDHGILDALLFGSDTGSYIAFLTHPAWARLAIILADVWKTTPFAALLILAGLQTIPEPLLEAARLDGAGPLRRFFSITLPLLRPAILVAVLFRVMDAFRVFDLVYVMTQGAARTGVLQYVGYKRLIEQQDVGAGTAISVIVFLMIGAVCAVTLRTAGARLLGERP
ncbi:MAG: carbohydrate ABC transporter permease [Acidobacteriota bacterium]